MGTLIRITLFTRNEPRAAAAILAAQARFNALDQILSDYKPDSELNRLCRSAYQKPTKVSRELFTVVQFAQRVSLLTHGAFDITIGARTRGRSGTVGYQYLSLGNRTISLAKPDMQLDLGAIAKGYAADEASLVLDRAGFHRHLIAASGDIVAGDAPPQQSGWNIGLGSEHNTRSLHRRAVSTSGNTNQPGHILNPATGEPILAKGTVTILARNGITSDALDTACQLLPASERLQLLGHFPGTELMAPAD